jgi:Trk-type K+ transport system membrane component
LDAIIGSIPLVGNLFDFVYKANDKNVRLLRRHYQEGKYTGSGWGIIIAVTVFMLILFGFIFYGLWQLGEYLWQYALNHW